MTKRNQARGVQALGEASEVGDVPGDAAEDAGGEVPGDRARRAVEELQARSGQRVIANMERMAEAYNRKAIVYPDYDPKKDFPSWLGGYREKVRNALGIARTPGDETLVDAEILRSIASKLACGPALDTYQRQLETVKADYAQLTKKLTEEFLDPQEKQRFLEDLEYNKRRKSQSIKDYMQDIIKDQNRYSDLAGEAKVKDGIRRFRNGIRNRRGKVDKKLKTQLRYNLHSETDMTWEKAVDIANRWEAAHDGPSSETSESSSDSDGANDEEVEAVTSKKKRGKRPSKKDRRKDSVIAAVSDDVAILTERVDHMATMSDKVEANAREIKGVKSENERMAANVTMWKDETSATLQEILQACKTNQQPQYQPRYMPQQFQRPRPQFQQPSYSNQQFNQNRGQIRPNNYVWKGRVGQTQQTGFRYNRSTPQTFPNPPAATAAPAIAPPPAAGQVGMACIEQMDQIAQPLGAEGGCETMTLPVDAFYELAARAGEPIEENDIIASVADLNFG